MTTFNIGDTVKHKGSFRHAVIIHVFQDKQSRPTGMYKVCTDYGEYHDISGISLELVHRPKLND